jgi:hypothetical protein
MVPARAAIMIVSSRSGAPGTAMPEVQPVEDDKEDHPEFVQEQTGKTTRMKAPDREDTIMIAALAGTIAYVLTASLKAAVAGLF